MTANIWAHIRSVRSDSRGTSSAFSHWYKSSQLLWHSAWVNQVEGLSAIVMCQQECWASRDPFSSGAIQPQTGALRPTEWNKQQFSLECIRDTFRLEGRLLQAGLANRENDKINSCFFLKMIHFWSFDRKFRFCFRLFCKHTWMANHDEAATNEPPNLDWKKKWKKQFFLVRVSLFHFGHLEEKKKQKKTLFTFYQSLNKHIYNTEVFNKKPRISQRNKSKKGGWQLYFAHMLSKYMLWLNSTSVPRNWVFILIWFPAFSFGAALTPLSVLWNKRQSGMGKVKDHGSE